MAMTMIDFFKSVDRKPKYTAKDCQTFWNFPFTKFCKMG